VWLGAGGRVCDGGNDLADKKKKKRERGVVILSPSRPSFALLFLSRALTQDEGPSCLRQAKANGMPAPDAKSLNSLASSLRAHIFANMPLSHSGATKTFTFTRDGGEGTAVLLYDVVDEGRVWELWHTEVPAQYRGKGLAAELVRAVLGWMREKGIKAVPTCSYIVALVERESEWDDVVQWDETC